MQTRTVVAALTGLPPAHHAAILARASGDVLDRARRSFPLVWFPMADHMHICEIIYEIVGRDAFMDLLGGAFETAIRTPMLRGIFGLITRVSESPVATLLRNAPRLYSHVTRAVGTLEGQVDAPGSARLEVRGWPSADFDFEVWLAGTEANVRTALHGVGAVDATIEVEQRGPERGFGAYRIRW